ncbi:MAG: hypothetical protein ABF643_02680 [Oenococcus oeni]
MDTGYLGLLPLRDEFPRNVHVLNIYGNIGDGNDGSVTTVSAKSYQEKEIYGKKGKTQQST